MILIVQLNYSILHAIWYQNISIHMYYILNFELGLNINGEHI